MIRLAVLPYGRSGIISAVMLGLGRALGETMAVAMVLSATGVVTFNLIGNVNPSTIAANIALQFPESTGLAVNALIASGLVLFVITFAVNFAARERSSPAARRGSSDQRPEHLDLLGPSGRGRDVRSRRARGRHVADPQLHPDDPRPAAPLGAVAGGRARRLPRPASPR